jgi:serine/threonine protein kinase
MGQGFGKLEDQYFLQKVKLGEGSFGTVWRAVDRQTKDVVAIKQLEKAAMPRRGVRQQDIENEISVMRAVRHENITRLLNFYEDDKHIYLALEYCDGGDFGDKVKERGLSLQEHEAADWMRQIILAINALHAKTICHRDIKPENFMVHGETLKLSDFGLARSLPSQVVLSEKCGTPAFMSPEQHKLPRYSRGYTNLCDIWAAGVTMYMVFFGGRHPFLNQTQQLDENKLLRGALDFDVNQGFFGLGKESRFSDQARLLCRRMVEPDTTRRPTIEEVLSDPWVGVNYNKVCLSENGGNIFSQFATSMSRQWTADLGYSNTGVLPVGGKCRYYSSSFYSWMPAVIQGFNEKDGTYNLDVRQHAKLKDISPDPLVPASEAWPPGTLVHYESGTLKNWLQAVVRSFNEKTGSGEGTYNLDVREFASIDKIRPRLANRCE